MKKTAKNLPSYHLDPDGAFVIENYNHAKPFASFFPGIAGKYGIPMWVFYVNRGQAISSFGIKDKDHAILEFSPANKAWQLTPTCGFRTFIKLTEGKKQLLYEPFHNGFTNLEFNLKNKMRITSWGLTLQEDNLSLGLRVNVEYFNIPNDSYAGLVRILTIENTGRKGRAIEILDGLPQIIPFGTNNWCLKEMSRTIEAWMTIDNLEHNAPFYKLAVDPSDRPEVARIKEGNFYLAFHHEKDNPKLIRPIIDAENIFGPVTDFSCPLKFLSRGFTATKNEVSASKTPCAFMHSATRLAAGAEKTYYALSGYMRDVHTLNVSLKRITANGYIEAKKEENRCLIENLESNIATASSSPEYDLYAKQTYLDNILRGGHPHVFKNGKVFYLYSRKHGDLERDYNKFSLQPTYFSQGNGSYRDANQNRRSDIWFTPEIKEENIITFLNLIQADGFNPLVIKGAVFSLRNPGDLKVKIKSIVDDLHLEPLVSFLEQPFTPGELALHIKEHGVDLKASCDDFLDTVISCASKIEEAEHGEGFWSDHWTYNLDLLESYLGVYPENSRELFFEKRIFTFFDNVECVRPRQEKYVRSKNGIMQLRSVYVDPAKKEMLANRSHQPHIVRDLYGQGRIYQTTLINKLLCLFANKMASLDASGTGIEMEANKPNWFDALNGLPALLGSSICETFELKRLGLMLKQALLENRIDKLNVTEEILAFLYGLGSLVNAYLNDSSTEKDFTYWDKSYSLKEEYRRKTKFGFSGREEETAAGALIDLVDAALKKLDIAIAKAEEKKGGLFRSYFYHEISCHSDSDRPHLDCCALKQKSLPLFLEGQMHAMRMAKDIRQAKIIYQATKESLLYDKKLKMYKVTAPLKSMPEEIGRCRIFPPGWLENESIWLHMEYKYLLEMLKQGLYDEFYKEFKQVLVPFQNPERYGRSILENSSFIVSSAFPDKDMHGRGFVARLSGSTAEFLQIWRQINTGPKPFIIDDKQTLALKLEPALAGWMFDKKEKTFGFNFLSTVRIVYHNHSRKNTFGTNGARIKKAVFCDKDGCLVTISGDTIPAPYAQQARSRQIKRIDIFLE